MSLSLYFFHETKTPLSIRMAWHNAVSVPQPGDQIDMGDNETWTVRKVVWSAANGGRSADVFCYTEETK